ncbi:hypothetical protein WJX74_002240 [Apatococcus lobatus]|uniref:Uncharacterized protein n=2 Tax=Apatococcus TaxID=904362 RepID=A0AAW1RCT5_9CHLO
MHTQVLYQAGLDNRQQCASKFDRRGLLGAPLRVKRSLLGSSRANQPRPIQILALGQGNTIHMRGMAGGRRQAGKAQLDDKAIAEESAREVCTADLLEIQRLTEQLEDVREWLHS